MFEDLFIRWIKCDDFESSDFLNFLSFKWEQNEKEMNKTEESNLIPIISEGNSVSFEVLKIVI